MHAHLLHCMGETHALMVEVSQSLLPLVCHACLPSWLGSINLSFPCHAYMSWPASPLFAQDKASSSLNWWLPCPQAAHFCCHLWPIVGCSAAILPIFCPRLSYSFLKVLAVLFATIPILLPSPCSILILHQLSSLMECSHLIKRNRS
jgi:hypothetical protein